MEPTEKLNPEGRSFVQSAKMPEAPVIYAAFQAGASDEASNKEERKGFFSQASDLGPPAATSGSPAVPQGDPIQVGKLNNMKSFEHADSKNVRNVSEAVAVESMQAEDVSCKRPLDELFLSEGKEKKGRWVSRWKWVTSRIRRLKPRLRIS